MKLELTTEQVNEILNSLAQQPYIKVYDLINEIQKQAHTQLSDNENYQNSKDLKSMQNELASAAETSSNGSN